MTPSADRLDPRIAESRAKVLTAVLEELAEVGYGAFAIESVSRRSGVAKSTIYRYWQGRPALVADALRSLNTQPGAVDAAGPAPEARPRERVVDIVRHLVTAFAGSPVADCTPALVDAAERDAELRTLFHEYTTERRRTLVDAVAAGVASGELRSDVEPELAAAALAGAVMYRRMMTPEPLRPEDVESLVVTVLGTPSAPDLALRPLSPADRAWVRATMVRDWGGTAVARRGELVDSGDLGGFVAVLDGRRAGMALVKVRGHALEVVVIGTRRPGRGIGRALMERCIADARERGCRRVWLMTTNDNVGAVEFYDAVGMRLVATHRGAVRAARALKPTIPLAGASGTPIEDELEFELVLD